MNGDIIIESSGRNLLLKTSMVDREMYHWHLDTFLMEYKPWQMREFVSFEIGPDGRVVALNVFGDTFERTPAGKQEK